ncbi:MAG: hypothetical protein JJU07_16435 [Natronohydrobacter sp.]|nr:hypothetical protein [Natronohydrobacter sp.]
MDQGQMEARLAELRAERERLDATLEDARVEAREAMIAGRKPSGHLAALAERREVVDAAVAELQDRLADAEEAEARRRRTRQVQAAIEAAGERRELAAAVDDAVARLAAAWPAYQDALRKGLGAAASVADVSPVERGLVTNRQNDLLVRVLIAGGGLELSRALGVETAIRPRHATTLTDAEGRLADGLHRELLRLRAQSPQPNVAREAQRELEALEGEG